MLTALLTGIGFMAVMGCLLGLLLTYAARFYPYEEDALVANINKLLPQTQCAQCGHPGCKPYAEAISRGEPINRCPPGGSALITDLAKLLGLEEIPLDEAFGSEEIDTVAIIREAECIGCTLCIQACPVDAILGAAQLMHTVMTSQCTGCDLCLEPCPVDCIDMIPLTEVADPLARHLLSPIKPKLHLADETACTRCGACEPVCPKLLQPQTLFWQQEDSDAMTDLNLDDCIECMLCDRACPSHLPLTRTFAETKQRIETENLRTLKALESEIRFERRTLRLSKTVKKVKSRSSAGDRAALLKNLSSGIKQAKP